MKTSSKPTWEQNPVELARTFASVAGIKGRPGGWFYGPNGKALAQGWDGFAAYLQQNGVIRVGLGVNWNTRRALWLQGVTR